MHVLLAAVTRFTQVTGICRNAINHAKAVADLKDARVTLIAGTWQEEYFRDALSDCDRIEFATAQCRNDSLSRNFWYAYELPRMSARLLADVVHVCLPAPMERSRFAVPLIATIHDTYPFDQPDNFGFPRVLLNRWFLKKCVAESDALVCVSKGTRERLAHCFGRSVVQSKVTTIYSYSELRKVAASQPVAFQSRRFILSVGQHRKNKNLDLLVRAYKRVVDARTHNSKLSLVIAGAGGPETAALHSLVRKLGLEGNVFFYSGLNDSALAWLYRNCELFVAASSVEGFCLPLVEAMELSPQVLCSDIPVFREIADRNCFFFSLNGPQTENLAHAIENALGAAPLQVLRVRRFSRENASRRYEELYAAVTRPAVPSLNLAI